MVDVGGHEDQVVVHLIAHEDFTELGDEQAFLEMASQLRQGPDIFGRNRADRVADGPLFSGFFVPRFFFRVKLPKPQTQPNCA